MDAGNEVRAQCGTGYPLVRAMPALAVLRCLEADAGVGRARAQALVLLIAAELALVADADRFRHLDALLPSGSPELRIFALIL